MARGANPIAARHRAFFLRRRGFASIGATKSVQRRLHRWPVDLGYTLAADTTGEGNVAILKIPPSQAWQHAIAAPERTHAGRHKRLHFAKA
jgi:hypothetical protein